MTSTDLARRAAARLRSAVEQAGDALAAPNVDALLASELALEAALADLPPFDDVPPGERAALRPELEAAARALLRCRRLGSGLSAFVRLSFEAQGMGGGYGRPEPASAGHTLNQRF